MSAKFLGPCGDASYSTYLVHGLALTLLLRVWEHHRHGLYRWALRCNRRWARGSHGGRKTYLTGGD